MPEVVYRASTTYEPALVFDMKRNLIQRSSVGQPLSSIADSYKQFPYLEQDIYSLAFNKGISEIFSFINDYKKALSAGFSKSKPLDEAYPNRKVRLYLARFVEAETEFSKDDLDLVVSCYQRLGDITDFEKVMLTSGGVEYDCLDEVLVVSGYSTVVFVPRIGKPVFYRKAPFIYLDLKDILSIDDEDIEQSIIELIRRQRK